MDLNDAFPTKFILTLPRTGERRTALEPRLTAAGLTGYEYYNGFELDRFPPGVVEYATVNNYASSMSQRHMISEAGRRNLPAIMLMEDDVVFHPDFQKRLAAIDLPEDWGIFYLGCLHLETPAPVSPGLVRVARALDTQAYAIKAKYFQQVTHVLQPHASEDRYSDVRISSLHKEIPTYACFPNLAWQELTYSNIAKRVYSNYDAEGRQTFFPNVVSGLN